MYKVMDSVGDPLYEVYCHFDSDGAWTLVHSCSFANTNGSDSQFKKSLSDNFPVGESGLAWSGYRLGKTKIVQLSCSLPVTMKNTMIWKNWTMFKFGLEI